MLKALNPKADKITSLLPSLMSRSQKQLPEFSPDLHTGPVGKRELF